jgi:hypothetical protein
MAAAAKDVYDNDNEQLEAWFGDRRAHARMCDALARMCDALARALRVRYAVMDYGYETRLELLCPHDSSFTSLDAYIDAMLDALVRALRTRARRRCASTRCGRVAAPSCSASRRRAPSPSAAFSCLLFLPVRRGRRERALALLSKEKGRAKE